MNDDSLGSVHRDRIASEAEFHNRRFKEEEGRAQDRFYGAINHGTVAYLDKVVAAARGADVLELGCALGVRSVTVAAVARSLVGVDLSSVAIDQASAHVAGAGLRNTAFSVMNAERLAFPDQSFDLVFGSGIIHHLDLDRSFRELARVLRRGGRAIFMEPLGHNPVINLYRRMTPEARTADEHPLVHRDFQDARRHFAAIDLDFYGLTTLAAVYFRSEALQRPLLRLGIALDRGLAQIPGIRWSFWHCCMTLHKGAGAGA